MKKQLTMTVAAALAAAVAFGASAINADPDAADLRVKMNLPYRGTSDGHTTALRREFPASRYAGVEVEVRNDLIASGAGQRRIGAMLARTLRSVVGAWRRASAACVALRLRCVGRARLRRQRAGGERGGSPAAFATRHGH